MLVTVGVGIAAVNTGNNLIYLMLGLLLSVLLMSMLLSEIALYKLWFSRTLPVRAFAGESTRVKLHIENQKRWFPSFSLELEDRVTEMERAGLCFYLKIDRGDKRRATYRFTPSARGYLRFEGYRVRTRYPFGLVEKRRRVDEEAEWLVYPAPVESSLGERLGHPHGESRTQKPRVGTGEVAGIREYRPGDEERDVHWRRTASLGTLVVRERQEDEGAELYVLLDNRLPEAPTEAEAKALRDRFERTVSEATGLVMMAHARGFTVRLRASGVEAPIVGAGQPLDPVLRFLALIESVGSDAPAPSVDARSGRKILSLGGDANLPEQAA